VKSMPLILTCFLLLFGAAIAQSAEIHDAVRSGDADAVSQALRDDHSSVNTPDENGRTPLALAAAGGRKEIVEILLANGADVNARNDRQSSTLHFAASRGDTEIVSILLEHGADVNARAIGQATPLCWASSAGRKEAAEVLLAGGADVNAECIDLWTPLYRAAWSGNVDLVNLLLEHGAEVNMKCVAGRTPLHNAVESGSEEVAGVLIERGAEIDTRDDLGKSPLWLAVERGNVDIARLLLESGAEIYPNQHESGQTVLHQAALRGYGSLVNLLIENKADPALADADGNTPAGLADRYMQSTAARALAKWRKSGAPRPRPNPLHYSLREGEAAVWYVGNYGVAIKTASHLMVLDYSEVGALPDEPSLANGHVNPEEVAGEEMVAVVPGLRTGYPIRAIMDMDEAIPDMTYILGFRTERGPEHVYVEPMSGAAAGEAMVASTAPNRYARGQDLLITLDGVTVYKAFSWNYWDEKSSLAYRQGLEFLGEKAGGCDIAIVPYAEGSEETQALILSDLLQMSAELRPRTVLCVGSAWQHSRDFAETLREQGGFDSVLYSRYPGDRFLMRDGAVERLR